MDSEACGLGTKRKGLRSFHELMQNRVQRILLVTSLYDSFIMSEEGHLHESLLSQFVDLNLAQVPDLVQVSGPAEALEAVGGDKPFDLVVCSLLLGETDAEEFASRMQELGHRVPVVALAFTNRDLSDFSSAKQPEHLERVFLWQGDVRLLLAMVKSVEDKHNVAHDTGVGGVPAILVVEDNARYYSSFLPAIYTELFQHTHRLLSESLNLAQKMMRMRARPKVLLCSSYEEAWEYFEAYGDQILGLISDVEFPRGGKLSPSAGIELCARIRKERPDMRLVLQSSNPANEELARDLQASFLLKGSAKLLHQLRHLLVQRFGFGAFIFRLPGGEEVDRAEDLDSMAAKLATVPGESLAYHAERHHFSNWLKARTEFALAERLRPRNREDFESNEHLRRYLLEMFAAARLERHRSVLADFNRETFEPTFSITRIGGGSLGGKARGVAFANRMLQNAAVDLAFPEVDIYVPPSVVVGTQVFDEFFEQLGLRDYASGKNPDEEILKRCLDAPFPRSAVGDLRSFLQQVKYPLAVRSSSLLEDSLSQPFAGVYQTFMLPNNDPDLDVRWRQLLAAIKSVYASVFTARAKGYLEMTSYRLEEEKMAVMIQELVGVQRGDRFYPDFAGTARSYNYYPEPGQAPEDGVAAVALGLGRTVVSGLSCLRFSPRYPRQNLSFASTRDALDNSQKEFHALDLSRGNPGGALAAVQRYPLEEAEKDGTLAWLGSTWVPEHDAIVDGIARSGVRLVSFAQVLKHDAYPLAAILQRLLGTCAEATGAPVEIEFAGNLGQGQARPSFGFLQLRPLALSQEMEQVRIGPVEEERVLCRSSRVLGNGVIEDVRDAIVVNVRRFDRLRSAETAQDVARFDGILRRARRPYLLVGVGRWGSSDPSLGIGVSWNQIAGARVIVEAGLPDLKVEPSQGTHFFQNLSSAGVGYLTVNPDLGEGYLDWDWLLEAPFAEERGCVRWLRFEEPLEIVLSGHTGEGLIVRPG